ncbi:MAG: hypothetical protein WD425_13650 [Nitrospirales bacterium]
MKFRNACGVGLILVGLASIIFIGCVRVIVNTQTTGAPKSPPLEEQDLLLKNIKISRFANDDTKITQQEVEEILDYASLVAQCGEDNKDNPRCDQEFPDMSNDFGCKIEYKLENTPNSNAQVLDWPPIFNFPQVTTLNPSIDPLDCRADGVVCSQNDLNAVWGKAPSNDGIKIVRDINFCENTLIDNEDESSWAACAQFPSFGQAIAIDAKNRSQGVMLQGILWLHEFGHTQDLHHIPNALSSDPRSVMASEVLPSKTKLNRKECYRLRQNLY